jgi:hypothetical protein
MAGQGRRSFFEEPITSYADPQRRRHRIGLWGRLVLDLCPRPPGRGGSPREGENRRPRAPPAGPGRRSRWLGRGDGVLAGRPRRPLLRAGARGPEGLIELVLSYRDQAGELRMRSRRERSNYPPAGGCGALVRAAARARGRGEELFLTPLPRTFAEPGKAAARAGSVVWVDVDGGSRRSELGRITALRPHLTVHSGGGVHAYSRLEREQELAQIESLNRRLCHLIGGDPACTDRGRIMRLPGSFNAKRGRWCRVLRADRSRALVDPDQVRRKLADPEPPPCPAPRSNGDWGADGLDRIDPPSYFNAVCGVDVPGRGRDGQVPAARPRRLLRLLPGVRRGRARLVVLRLLPGRSDLRPGQAGVALNAAAERRREPDRRTGSYRASVLAST